MKCPDMIEVILSPVWIECACLKDDRVGSTITRVALRSFNLEHPGDFHLDADSIQSHCSYNQSYPWIELCHDAQRK